MMYEMPWKAKKLIPSGRETWAAGSAAIPNEPRSALTLLEINP